jgi:hypothetical protein
MTLLDTFKHYKIVPCVSAENAPMLLPVAAEDKHFVHSDVVFLTKIYWLFLLADLYR